MIHFANVLSLCLTFSKGRLQLHGSRILDFSASGASFFAEGAHVHVEDGDFNNCQRRTDAGIKKECETLLNDFTGNPSINVTPTNARAHPFLLKCGRRCKSPREYPKSVRGSDFWTRTMIRSLGQTIRGIRRRTRRPARVAPGR